MPRVRLRWTCPWPLAGKPPVAPARHALGSSGRGLECQRIGGIGRHGDAKGMAKQSLLREFWLFVKEEKKWWLVPLILVLLIVGALVVFASSSPLAPFLYPLF